MRLIVIFGLLAAGWAHAAAVAPAHTLDQATSAETGSLRSIAGWLKQHGKEEVLGDEVR